MYRTSLRSVSRPALSGLRGTAVRCAPRRFASTASPADKSRSWKSSALRWGLAAGAVYYYSTSSVFAEEAPADMVPPPAVYSDDDVPTVDAIVEQKRKQIQRKTEESSDKKQPSSSSPSKNNTNATQNDSQQPSAQSEGTAAVEGSPEALEEEAGQQGAFNPETGEINWDCPCLGGMADGPCGEDFKAAFSCFVYSEEEPKGMDCIEKFQGMQECFKKYPEIYGSELQDDEDGDGAPEGMTQGVPEGDGDGQGAGQAKEATSEKPEQKPVQERQTRPEQPKLSDNSNDSPTKAESREVKTDDVFPPPATIKAHDATAANDRPQEKQDDGEKQE